MKATVGSAQALLRRSDDAALPITKRRAAAVELLRLHARPGMSLGDFAALLRGASWLASAHVRAVRDVGGRPAPVPLHLGGSVFAFDLVAGDDIAPQAFVRAAGGVMCDEFASLLRGTPTPSIASAAVLDIAVQDV